MNGLEVINLGENSNLFASISARIFDLLNVLHRCYIRHTDIVKVVLDSDTQDVILILGLKDRKLREAVAWNENLAASNECSCVLELYFDLVLLRFENNSMKGTRIETNIVTRSYGLGNIGIVDLDNPVIACS